MECLELGPGAGSVMNWMLEKVGPKGQVTAIDLDIRFAAQTKASNLTIQKMNILDSKLKPESFDMIHGRYVVMHIPEYQRALSILNHSLKPGGWILLEEPDFGIAFPSNFEDDWGRTFTRISEAIKELYQSMGIQWRMGRKVPSLFQNHGLQNLGTDVSAFMSKGGSGVSQIMKRSVEYLREPLLKTGKTLSKDVDLYIKLCDELSFWATYYATFSTWGKKK
jgi:trans-aconitate methyltransferase